MYAAQIFRLYPGKGIFTTTGFGVFYNGKSIVYGPQSSIAV